MAIVESGATARPLALLAAMLVFAAAAQTVEPAARPPSDYLILPGADWRYHAGEPPAADWTDPDFDDGAWRTGAAGFGYGDGDDATVLGGMRGNYSAVHIRRSFEVAELPGELWLYIKYDDGFIAWINGREVARANIAGPDATTAKGSSEAEESHAFRLPVRALRRGRNLLAIKGVNVDKDSSDLSLYPALRTARRLPNVITREEALMDLGALRRRLLGSASYLSKKNQAIVIKRLDNLMAGLPSRIYAPELGRFLQLILGDIGDSHASVRWRGDRHGRYLGFRLGDAAGGVVAVALNNRQFVDKNHPYLVALDGVPLATWMELAGFYVNQGSPQQIRRASLSELRRVDNLRRQLKLPDRPHIALTLANAAGETKTRRRKLSESRRSRASIHYGDSRMLDGNIGYLRIPDMHIRGGDMDPHLEQMERFRDSAGLIIDVRDNPGGYYDLALALYGYFAAPGSPPYVAHICRSRLAVANPDSICRPHAQRNYVQWDLWPRAERAAIDRAMTAFKPEWQPQDLSQWSDYLVLLAHRHQGQFHYDKPVIVLSNAASFSATDIFLSIFSDLPQVRIMGTPSSGGSGNSLTATMPLSGISIRLSSMIAYRPSGRTFDGNGIEVDIHQKPLPGDFTGRQDSVLEAAHRLLLGAQ